MRGDERSFGYMAGVGVMRATVARAAIVCALLVLGSGCGDPEDVRLPLSLPAAQQPALPPLETVAPPPLDRAVLAFAPVGADAACSRFAWELPNADALQTVSTNGNGPRAVNGDGLEIACRVSASVQVPDAFDVAFDVTRPGRLAFRGSGRVVARSEAAPSQVAIALDVSSDADSVQLQCSGAVVEALPGALWIAPLRCEGANAMDAGSCRFEGGVIFENCER